MFKPLCLAALFGLGLGGAQAQQDGSVQGTLSPETGALISVGMTVAQRDAAITDFVQEGKQAGALLALARAGDRDAARIIGRECLRNSVCPASREESHQMLVKAAGTQWASAEELAAIYRDGAWGGRAYPVIAAQWLAHAIELGSPNAAMMLDGLPIEAVREAGAEHLLRQPDRDAEPGGAYGLDEDQALVLGDMLFGTADGGGPTVVDWPGQAEGFPVFADTAMNALTDAAMSCHLIGAEKVDALIERRARGQTSRLEEISLHTEGFYVQLYFDTLTDAALNGGASETALGLAYQKHNASKRANPGRGPSAEFCRSNFPAFMAAVD